MRMSVCACVCACAILNIALGSSWQQLGCPSVRSGASFEKGSDGDLLIMEEVGGLKVNKFNECEWYHYETFLTSRLAALTTASTQRFFINAGLIDAVLRHRGQTSVHHAFRCDCIFYTVFLKSSLSGLLEVRGHVPEGITPALIS